MKPRRIIVDTDVASLSIKQALPPALLRELLGAQVGITFVTLGELHRWSLLRGWGARKRASLDAWLSARPTLPYTDDVARKWGEIAAVATLATLNIKDFADYAAYDGLTIVGG